MQNINCVTCGASSNDVAIKENGYNGMRCNACQLIYISPRPSLAEMHSDYETDNEYGHGTSPYLNDRVRFRSHGSKTIEANNSLKIIEKYKKVGRILEIGPGPGLFMIQAKNAGYSPVGLEINKSRAKYLNEMGLSCISASLEEVDFSEAEKVDVLYHRDAISHFYDPHEAITSMRRMLLDDGILIFETGNIGELNRFWLSLYPNFHYPGHLFFYSEKSLKLLLTQCGFEVILVRRYPFVLDVLYMSVARAVKRLLGKIGCNQIEKDAMKCERQAQDLKSEFIPSITDKLVNWANRLRASSRYGLFWAIPSFVGLPAQILVVAKIKK